MHARRIAVTARLALLPAFALFAAFHAGLPDTAGAQTPPPTVEITPADNGSTIRVVVGQGVTVRLGATLQWTVSYDPPGVLLAVPGVNTTTRDVQAILRAAQA